MAATRSARRTVRAVEGAEGRGTVPISRLRDVAQHLCPFLPPPPPTPPHPHSSPASRPTRPTHPRLGAHPPHSVCVCVRAHFTRPPFLSSVSPQEAVVVPLPARTAAAAAPPPPPHNIQRTHHAVHTCCTSPGSPHPLARHAPRRRLPDGSRPQACGGPGRVVARHVRRPRARHGRRRQHLHQRL